MILRLFFIWFIFEFFVLNSIGNYINLFRIIVYVIWRRIFIIFYKILWWDFLFWELFRNLLKMFGGRLSFLSDLCWRVLSIFIYRGLSIDSITIFLSVFEIFTLIKLFISSSFNKFLYSFLDVWCKYRYHLFIKLILSTEIFCK